MKKIILTFFICITLFGSGFKNGKNILGYSELANKYFYGLGVKQNKTKAIKLYVKACDYGEYVLGCYTLGSIYVNGEGVKENSGKALVFFAKACNGGIAVACSNVNKLIQK